MSRDTTANSGHLAARVWAPVAVALCAAAALGVAVALGQSLTLIAVAAVAIALTILSLGRRAFWVLPVVALGIAAVPHGAEADALLAWRVAGVTIQSSDMFVVPGLLATACLVRAGGLVHTKRERRWVLALGMFFLVQACAAAWGLMSGNTVKHLLQDVRPLLGYALGLGGIALGRHAKGAGLLAGAIVLSTTFTAGLTVAMLSGMLSLGRLATETGGLGIRNGILWVLAIPLTLQYALSSSEPTRLRLVAGVLFVVNLAGLAWSGARTLWLAVTIALVYQMVLLVRSGKLRLRIQTLIVVCAVGALVAVVTGPLVLRAGWLPDPIEQRLSTITTLQTDSSLGTRLVNFPKANAVISKSPLLGGGLGARVVLYGRSGAIHEDVGQYVDNVLQTILLKSGMFGLAAFAFLFFVAASGVSRAAAETGDPLMVSAQASIPALVILMASSAFLAVWAELAVFALVWGVAYGVLGRATE